MPPSLDDPVMPIQVRELVDNRQYTFQTIEDGAILQLHYLFGSDELLSANLAYYSAGVTDDMPVGWYRIDYDPVREGGVIHAGCHFHLGLFPNMRLVVDGVPTPRQFVEFVIASCYPDSYQRHRLGSDGKHYDVKRIHSVNTQCFDLPTHEACKFITHIRVPRQCDNLPLLR